MQLGPRVFDGCVVQFSPPPPRPLVGAIFCTASDLFAIHIHLLPVSATVCLRRFRYWSPRVCFAPRTANNQINVFGNQALLTALRNYCTMSAAIHQQTVHLPVSTPARVQARQHETFCVFALLRVRIGPPPHCGAKSLKLL